MHGPDLPLVIRRRDLDQRQRHAVRAGKIDQPATHVRREVQRARRRQIVRHAAPPVGDDQLNDVFAGVALDQRHELIEAANVVGWITGLAEFATCSGFAAWLLYRGWRMSAAELFVFTFAAATITRYVLRKELLQDIRGLRQGRLGERPRDETPQRHESIAPIPLRAAG